MDPYATKHTLLLVDDIPANIDVLCGIFGQDYRLKVATNGEKALKVARSSTPPDLILLDVVMPGLDGYEVCKRLKDAGPTAKIPVIFVTSEDEIEDEAKGFEVGAVDYVKKPVNPLIVRARVKTHIELRDSRVHLEELLSGTLIGTVKVLTDILSMLSPEISSVASRLRQYVKEIGANLGLTDVWRFELAALLSRVGCATMQPHIWAKIRRGDRLTPDERDQFASYPAAGRDLIAKIPRLQDVAEMIGRQRDVGGAPSPQLPLHEWDTVTLGSEILRLVTDFDRLVAAGTAPQSAIRKMLDSEETYSPVLLSALCQTQVSDS